MGGGGRFRVLGAGLERALEGLGGRGVVAPIVAISILGVASAGGVPLIALSHEAAGVSPAWIGAAAACGAAAILLGAQIAPALMRRLGPALFIALCLGATAAALLAFKAVESFAARCLIQAALGVASAGLFTATEYWIMGAAPAHRRGRVAGVYALMLSAGFAAGPAVLLLTGASGWPPFLALAALALAAAAPLAWGGDLAPAMTPRDAEEAERPPGVMAFFLLAPGLMGAAALFGALELGAGALLPVWGLSLGLSEPEAVGLGLSFALGGFALQPLLAWACDRYPAERMVLLAGAGCLFGALALMLAARGDVTGEAAPWGLYVVLFLWGGVSAGLYIAALVAIGGRVGGAALASGAAALVAGYGLGALVGPTAIGAAMEWGGALGLPAAIAIASAAYLLVASLAARRALAA